MIRSDYISGHSSGVAMCLSLLMPRAGISQDSQQAANATPRNKELTLR